MCLAWLTGDSWPGDLFTHFPLQYLVGSSLALLVLIFLRRWIFAAFALIVVLIQSIAMIIPFAGNVPKPKETSQGEVLLHMHNIQARNENCQELRESFAGVKADVVLVVELPRRTYECLRMKELGYSWELVKTREDSYGIGLFSKLPLDNPRVLTEYESLPTLAASIRVGESSVNFLGVHTLPPKSKEYWLSRNVQMRQLAKDLAGGQIFSDNGPVIVAGDFNTTPWSQPYKAFIKDSGVIDVRQRTGRLMPTWPSWAPGYLFQIPIDHIFLSPDLSLKWVEIGRAIGSDHLSMTAKISF